MHYLVTGGCGFIGSHLCDALITTGHRVSVLDDLSTGKRENLATGAELVVGDITDAALVSRLMQGKDGCFHLAAIASVELSRRQWQRTHAVNLSGTINVFDTARAAGNLPVVYASSAAVFGSNTNLPLRETSEAKPLSTYGADKLGCELHARAAAVVHGLPSIGMRFFNCYGPRQDPASPYSGVISIFAQRIRTGQPITVFGDGEQTRDFIYVADVVAHLVAAMKILEHNNRLCEVVNVCTGQGTSLLQLIKTLDEICGTTTAPQFAAAREGDIRHSLGDNGHAIDTLGLCAATPLKNGLALLLEHRERPS